MPVPLVKISHLLPTPTRTPRLGEKWLICANGTGKINESHLGACPHQVRPVDRLWSGGEGVTGTAWVRPRTGLRLYGCSPGGRAGKA